MADNHQMFIDGEWVNSSDGATRDIISPATGEVIATVQEGTAEDANRAIAAAKRIVEEGLNVRQAEALAHDEGVPERKPQKPRGGKIKDPDTVALEKRVSDALGLAVTVNHRDPGGTVQIRYRDLEQLDEILRRLDKGN